ncbi:MAG TPA: transporter substrate-binding domain-containing protein [Mycoplana sp.]|nr:transporter substrate-binding domain-containing protein [Mycoplana sp.]
MKKTTIIVAMATALGIVAAGAASAETIKVGLAAEPYPPFTSPDATGNWQGWEIDFQKALCAEAKLDCVLTPVAWDGIIPALTSKKIDVIIGSMTITDERMKTIDFSDRYYKTPSGVIGTKGVAFEPTPEGLAGKTIGVQVSTTQEVYANTYFSGNGSTVKIYQTQDEANQDLVAGRIDAIQADLIPLEDFLKTEEGQACCEMKGVVKDDPAILGAGTGIGLRKGEDELKAKLNAAIKAIRDNGTYAEFTMKYFSFDIYGE